MFSRVEEVMTMSAVVKSKSRPFRLMMLLLRKLRVVDILYLYDLGATHTD
jgi:hypothetical protein